MAGAAALILGGGSAVRFGGDVPKQYLTLAGRAVLRHSAETFASHPDIDAVRVVIRADDRTIYDDAMAGLDILAPVTGGTTRQESSRLGLESLAELAPDRVLIHDAARPFIDEATISRIIDLIFQRLRTNRSASQSSSFGCEGRPPWTPKLSTVATSPRPKR